MLVSLFLLALLGAGFVRPLAAQSLADLARQEEERRKALKVPAKVISNKDLQPAPTQGVTAPPASADPAKPDDSTKAADPKAGEAKTGDKDKTPAVKDQAYWSEKAKSLQTQLDRDQGYSEALQVRINSLSADFVNRDDPAQRAVIGADRLKALAELDRLKTAIVADKKAIADFAEEARRAGVPPGWLR
jgi:hypothetical protein